MFDLSFSDFLERVSKYRMLLDRQLIKDHEFGIELANNLVLVVSSKLSDSVTTLTKREVHLVDQYLERHIRNEDFMPFPSCFLAPNDIVEDRKLELRPRYLEINKLICQAKEKLSSGSSP